MNRYPFGIYLIIGFTLLVAFVYTLPNFYGEVPAVQVSPVRATLKADTALLARVECLHIDLILCLHLDETHRWARGRFGDSLRVTIVVLLCLDT